MTIKRALISVSNKNGVIELARGLAALGVEIVSTGGTAKTLREADVPVTYITDVTGFPEILDGRVKTLHPNVHGGILAQRTGQHLEQLQQHQITPIDLVVVNLYPFQATVADPDVTLAKAIENIDIGGPTMVRAAAKNHQYVLVLVNPDRYEQILTAIKNNQITTQLRLQLAQEAFEHTAVYDTAIANYLYQQTEQTKVFPPVWPGGLKLVQTLRYGENPHQKAAFYRDPAGTAAGVGGAVQLHGKELSYNNILDLHAAWETVMDLPCCSAVIVKHNNPCGAASADDLSTSYQRAYECDPVSAFGGIVALSGVVDVDTARKMNEIFLEAVIAPEYHDDALAVLKEKENLRILKTDSMAVGAGSDKFELRKVTGGLLVQNFDRGVVDQAQMKAVTKRTPSEQEAEDLLFAMAVVKHVKSNAIVLVKDKTLLGVGAGQMNRVTSVRIALQQAGDKAKGAVLGSDAFFPFADSLQEASRAGVTAVIQPGGSLRDQESIDVADQNNMAMLFTGMRHFKH